LLAHLPLFYRMGNLQKPVSQSGLPVVNMSDDGEIAYVLHRENLTVFDRLCDVGGFDRGRFFYKAAVQCSVRFHQLPVF